MTALLTKSHPEAAWQGMPGWGIVADLTPPELITARQLSALRRVIGITLAAIILLCAAGYVDAMLEHSSAANDLASADARTNQLVAEQGKYARVTQVQAATEAVMSQVRTLTRGAVDVAAVLHRLRVALPGAVSLTSANVSVTNPAELAAPAAPTLNSTGRPIIGSVTLTGTSRRIVDIASYVDALTKLRGVVNVIPTQNNSASAASAATWSVTAQLTDAVMSVPARSSASGGN